jgi:hypothetical protein
MKTCAFLCRLSVCVCHLVERKLNEMYAGMLDDLQRKPDVQIKSSLIAEYWKPHLIKKFVHLSTAHFVFVLKMGRHFLSRTISDILLPTLDLRGIELDTKMGRNY